MSRRCASLRLTIRPADAAMGRFRTEAAAPAQARGAMDRMGGIS